MVARVPADAPADDLEDIWGRVRGELQDSLPNSTFNLWLKPLRAVSIQGTTLVLSAPASVRTWVERRYDPEALMAAYEANPAASFVVDRLLRRE